MKTRHFLIADDHTVMRQTIIRIIRDEWPDAICEEVSDGVLLLAKVMEVDFDLVISDISMPNMNGLEALKAAKSFSPDLPMLLVSICNHDRYAMKALRCGAAGFIPKLHLHQALVKAMHAAMAGK